MANRALLQAEVFAAEARLRIVEWQIEDRLRSRQARPSPRQAPAPARRTATVAPIDQDALDEQFARDMLAMPRQYPAYRDWPLESLTQLVRAWRTSPPAPG
jgi:hypothetical protein